MPTEPATPEPVRTDSPGYRLGEALARLAAEWWRREGAEEYRREREARAVADHLTGRAAPALPAPRATLTAEDLRKRPRYHPRRRRLGAGGRPSGG